VRLLFPGEQLRRRREQPATERGMRAMTESSERLSDARAAASERYVRPVAAVADSDARRKAATNLSADPEQPLTQRQAARRQLSLPLSNTAYHGRRAREAILRAPRGTKQREDHQPPPSERAAHLEQPRRRVRSRFALQPLSSLQIAAAAAVPPGSAAVSERSSRALGASSAPSLRSLRSLPSQQPSAAAFSTTSRFAARA
jgi:hypothetical protein